MYQVPLDLGEPEFDLVQPGGISGREVQMDLRIGFEELSDLGGFMSGQIVEDDVDFRAFACGS